MRITVPSLTTVGLVAGVLTVVSASQLVPPRNQAVRPAAGKRMQTPTAARIARGADLLAWSLRQLQARRSVSARLLQQIDLLGIRATGSGLYLDARSGDAFSFRLEIEFDFGGSTSRLVRVCDGRRLWIYEEMAGQKDLKQVDLERVRRVLQQQGRGGDVEKAAWTGKLGRLEGLLITLSRDFQFGIAHRAELYGVPTWKLTGTLDPEELPQQWSGPSGRGGGTPPGGHLLPAEMPDQVVVQLGRDDGFPYSIEYWRTKGRAGQGGGRLVSRIVFHQVTLDGPISPAFFTIESAGLDPVDQTDAFLNDVLADSYRQPL